MKLEHSRFAKISAKLEQRCSLSFNSGAHEGLNGLWVLFKTGNTCCNAETNLNTTHPQKHADSHLQPHFPLASPVRCRRSSLPPTTRLEASCWRCAAALREPRREGPRWGAAAFGSSRSLLWHGGAHDLAHRPRRPMTAQEPDSAMLVALTFKRDRNCSGRVLLRDSDSMHRESQRPAPLDDCTTCGFAANLGPLLRGRSAPRPPLQKRTKAPSMDSRLEAGDPKGTGSPSRLSSKEKAPKKAPPRRQTKTSTDPKRR